MEQCAADEELLAMASRPSPVDVEDEVTFEERAGGDVKSQRDERPDSKSLTQTFASVVA